MMQSSTSATKENQSRQRWIHRMDILTTGELASALKISKATTLTLVQRGIIPAFRAGRALRFDLYEVIDALKANGSHLAGRKAPPLESPPLVSSLEQRTFQG